MLFSIKFEIFSCHFKLPCFYLCCCFVFSFSILLRFRSYVEIKNVIIFRFVQCKMMCFYLCRCFVFVCFFISEFAFIFSAFSDDMRTHCICYCIVPYTTFEHFSCFSSIFSFAFYLFYSLQVFVCLCSMKVCPCFCFESLLQVFNFQHFHHINLAAPASSFFRTFDRLHLLSFLFSTSLLLHLADTIVNVLRGYCECS